MSPSADKTELARWRQLRGLTQRKMAELMGLSLPAYKRFERGEIVRPRLAYFVNASIILDVPLELLIDSDYLAWRSLSEKNLLGPPREDNAEIAASEEWNQRPPPHYPR